MLDCGYLFGILKKSFTDIFTAKRLETKLKLFVYQQFVGSICSLGECGTRLYHADRMVSMNSLYVLLLKISWHTVRSRSILSSNSVYKGGGITIINEL